MTEAIADRALAVILKEFLRCLDPRSLQLLAMDRIQTQLQEIADAQERAETANDEVLRELVVQLPPNARPSALDNIIHHRAEAHVMLEALVRDEHGVARAVMALVSSPPAWLMNAGYRTWLCLAEVAAGHGQTKSTVRAYEEAVSAGAPNQGHWYAKAAIAVLPDEESSLRLAEESRKSGGDSLIDLVEPIIRRNNEMIVNTCGRLLAEGGGSERDLLLGLQARAELLLGHWDACVATCRRLLAGNDQITTVRITLAQALLRRIQAGGSRQVTVDWQEAMDQLKACRDLRRQWGGASHEAVALAGKAAVLVHDFALCLELGREAPSGEAAHSEASEPEVLRQVIAAAIVLGRLEVAEDLVPALPDGFEKTLQVGLLSECQGESEEARTKYLEAVQSASDKEELFAGILALAGVGEESLPRLQELRTDDGEAAELCEAMSLLQRKKYGEAIKLLRPYNSRRALDLLAVTQQEAGQLDESLRTYRQIHDRFQDGAALVKAAEMYFLIGNIPRAEAEIDRSLGLVPSGTLARSRLLRLRVEIAAREKHWGEVVTRAEAYRAEGGTDDLPVTWALLFSLNNQGRIPDAVEVLGQEPALMPANEDEAHLFSTLARQLNPSPELTRRLIKIGWDFEDVESVCAVALAVAYETSRDAELDAGTVSSLHELTEAFLERFPGSGYFRRIEFTSVEDLLSLLRDELAERGAALAEAAQRIDDEALPQGVLSSYSGRPYAEVLLRRAAGFAPIARADRASKEREMENARVALNRRVVIDTSALVSLSYIPARWRDVISAFDSVVIHVASRLDMQSAKTVLDQRGTLSVGWDPASDRPVPVEIPLEQVEDLAVRASWIAERANELPVPADAEKPGLEIDANQLQRLLPWLGPVALARDLGIALISDDVGQQRLAEGEGVPVFGSLRLLDVLVAIGQLSGEDVSSTRQVLLENWCVDLEPTGEEVVRLGERTDWGPSPAALQLSRPSFWSDPSRAFDVYKQVMNRVSASAPEWRLSWVAAALGGVARAARNDAAWLGVAAPILQYALWLAGAEPRTFRDLLGTARDVALRTGRADPLPAFAESLFGFIEEQSSSEVAMQEVMNLIGDLDEPDRLMVLRQLLQP